MEHFQKPIHHCIHKCKLKCYQAHFRWAWGVAESFVVWWKPKETNKVYTAWLSCTYERAPLNLSYQLPSRRHLFLADFSKIMSNHNLHVMYYSSTVLFCIQWHSVAFSGDVSAVESIWYMSVLTVYIQNRCYNRGTQGQTCPSLNFLFI